jgi:hypothetical protein
VREGLHIGTTPELAHLVDVQLVRREQQVGVDVAPADQLPDEREAVRVQAERGETEHDVPGLDPRAVDYAVTRNQPDARACEVELLLAVDARHLRRLAAEERTPGGAARLSRALDELGHLLERERMADDVVEEEERIGAGRDHVVDAMRCKVGSDPA